MPEAAPLLFTFSDKGAPSAFDHRSLLCYHDVKHPTENAPKEAIPTRARRFLFFGSHIIDKATSIKDIMN